MKTRRNFIKTTAAGVAGVSITNRTIDDWFNPFQYGSRHFHAFTKCLQFLDYDEMAEVLARNGFDGADLTVRPGGQVLPENVESDLPKVMKALKKAGIGSDMIVTNITDADHPNTRPILKTMANLGIKYYRMGYIDYNPKISIPENLDRFKTVFKKLEKLNHSYNVTANYQNHSGDRVGGPVWDLYYLIKDCDPQYMGIQYDIRHATVEGSMSWPLGMKLLAPWIQTTDIKDFIWNKNENGEWIIQNVPLGEGIVDFKKYFELYKSLQIEAPVSIHFEYDLGGAEHGQKEISMRLDKIESLMKKDLMLLKNELPR